MSFNPTFDYANATDEDLARLALAAGKREFDSAAGEGLLNNDSLHTLFGKVEDGEFVELGRQSFGTGWKEFVENVSPESGKIATVVKYRMDSADAVDLYGEHVGTGPRQWPGGVRLSVSVTLKSGEKRTCELAGASSGVQGLYDADITSAVLRRYAAAWAEREKAREAATIDS